MEFNKQHLPRHPAHSQGWANKVGPDFSKVLGPNSWALPPNLSTGSPGFPGMPLGYDGRGGNVGSRCHSPISSRSSSPVPSLSHSLSSSRSNSPTPSRPHSPGIGYFGKQGAAGLPRKQKPLVSQGGYGSGGNGYGSNGASDGYYQAGAGGASTTPPQKSGMLRSGARYHPKTPQKPNTSKGYAPGPVSATQQSQSQTMSRQLPVYLVKYNKKTAYLHWAIYVEYPQGEEGRSFICHVMGSSGNFRYERRSTVATTSPSFAGRVLLGYVLETNVDRLEASCRNNQTHNEESSYDCQYWVIDAFDGLVIQRVLQPTVSSDQIASQMDGLA